MLKFKIKASRSTFFSQKQKKCITSNRNKIEYILTKIYFQVNNESFEQDDFFQKYKNYKHLNLWFRKFKEML